MIKPTEFPCTAWYVTQALVVRQVTVTRDGPYEGFLHTDGPYCVHNSALYETREEGVSCAKEKLAQSERRMLKAQESLERKRKRVEALKAESGGPTL